jgi:predicted glutamine amidotransferase
MTLYGMCRLVAALSTRPRALQHALVAAPRSLKALSVEHRHGWGVAAHREERWSLSVGTPPAHEDPAFDDACAQETHAWIAHVRLATVGSVQRGNTHPFLRGRWCFAHNGTIRDQDFLRERTSAQRDGEREGSTDSERFFAYILTRLDQEGLASEPACGRVDRALVEAVREATEREGFGAVNFVLSDGEALYVHRLGRTLSIREEDGLFVAASEPWSDDDAWRPFDDRALVRVEIGAGRTLRQRTLRAC